MMFFLKIYNFLQKKIIFLNRKLSKNLFWSFIGGVGASGIIFLVNIISGRYFGPEQYGVASFIMVVAQSLYVLAIGGVDFAISKNITQTRKQTYERLISSAFFVTIISLIFFSLVGIILINMLSDKYSMFVLLGFSLTNIIGIRMFFEGVLRGLELFQVQSIYKIIDAGIVFVIISFLIFTEHIQSYVFIIIPFIMSGIFVVFLYFKKFIKYIKIKFVNIDSVKKIFQFGQLFIISSILTTVFVMIDRVVIGKYLSMHSLGIYSAYATLSITLVNLLKTIVYNVFFGHSAKHENKTLLSRVIDKLTIKWFVPGVILLFCFISIAIIFYGKEYEYNIIYALLFAIFGSISFFASLYNPIIITYSKKLFKKALWLMSIRMVLVVSYIFLLIKYNILSINLLLIGFIVITFVGIIQSRFLIRKYIM